MRTHPVIGITMGDPSGIGPEIIRKALSDRRITAFCRPLVLGDYEILSSVFVKNSEKTGIKTISSPSEINRVKDKLALMPITKLKRGEISPGKPADEGGKAMVAYIIKAVDMALKGELDAIVTCPINKALMNSVGYTFEGHTQLISSLTNTGDYVMMLAGDKLRVTLATIHCSYIQVPSVLKPETIYKTIVITADALNHDFGIERPRLAVAALNPHAGESGLFGSEEEQIISPATSKAQFEGYDAVGPLPADTLFHKAASGQFDAVVAMYHDQGLIPLKLLHFSDAVNVTLGLPIVRTSVDHGTAYDIAGKGIADPSSLKSAIRMAAEIVKNRHANGNRTY